MRPSERRHSDEMDRLAGENPDGIQMPILNVSFALRSDSVTNKTRNADDWR